MKYEYWFASIRGLSHHKKIRQREEPGRGEDKKKKEEIEARNNAKS